LGISMSSILISLGPYNIADLKRSLSSFLVLGIDSRTT